MKNLIILLVVLLSLNTVANAQMSTKTSKGATTKTTYTCAMHPEVMSSEKGKCPKCGMKLMEKSVVKKEVSSKKNQVKVGKAKMYSCPMHPESKGKLNEKCPKCGMNLTEEVK